MNLGGWSVVVVAAALGASCQKTQPAVEPSGRAAPPGEVWLTPAQVHDAKIEISTVGERDVDDKILTSGTVSLEDQLTGHVFSPVNGRVVSITAQLGQQVKRGEALAVIESPDIGTAVSDVHKAQADLIASEHDLRRKKDLYEQKATSAAELEASQDAYRRAKAELERAQAKEGLLHVPAADGVTQRYPLLAPVDGEVLMRDVNPGMEVQGQYAGGTAQELFTIGELDRVWVLGQVFEMDLPRVHVGAPASVNVVAYPKKPFIGQVDWVSGQIDEHTRTATVRCHFDNTDRLLRPMMYATMEISVDQKRAVAIPRNALLRLGDSKVVFTQVGEGGGYLQFAKAPVDVDEGESSPWLEVRHGLTGGQKVVVSGAILLSSML
jgi:cobalt-zinc-cadmium efflux system membrane fusion protein